jgi:type II secretory pathway pseudopilin PulG
MIVKKNILGYTIVELLAVIAILVIISGVISGILYSTLRGSNKTKITTNVTQNGNYAISVISAAIINSRSITQIDGSDITDCTTSPSGSSITLTGASGGTTVFSCQSGDITSNGNSLIDTTVVQVADSSCSFYCSQEPTNPYSIPLVGVAFTIEDKSSEFAESQGSAAFDSATSLRNYSP